MDRGELGSLEAVVRSKLRTAKRVDRLTKGIVPILIAAAVIGFLVSATLALVGVN